MRHEFFGDQAPICTQYMASDMAVNGMTDKAAPPFDWVSKLLPTNMPDGDGGKWGWYWSEGWKGIKYANTALDRRVLAAFKNEAEENEVIGVEGLEAALVAAERNMRHEFFGDQAPICTQYMASDMAVNGMTDKATPPFDWVSKLLPTNMPDGDGGKWGWYWKEGWKVSSMPTQPWTVV